jgi:hypothetical protein
MSGIYTAISNVMSEIGAIGKDKENTQQHFKYRGIDDVMNALQPLLVKHRVFIVPETLEQLREEKTSKAGATLIYSICKIKYTFYAEDGSNIVAVAVGEGMDSGDKATNKAMAIAFKYACFQVFCIPTEEIKDPDGDTHELQGITPQNAPQQNKPVGTDNHVPATNQGSKNDSGGSETATKAQVAEVFKAAAERKEKFPGFDLFKHLEEMLQAGRITTKYTYADKAKTKVNWTQKDVFEIMSDLELPF